MSDTTVYIERQQSNGYLYSFYSYADSLSEALGCLGQIGDDHDYESGMVFLVRRYENGPILAKLELRHESREEFASRRESRSDDMEPIDHMDPGDLLAPVDHPGGWS